MTPTPFSSNSKRMPCHVRRLRPATLPPLLRRLAIVEDDTPNAFALSAQLKQFIERTNFLARWCEKEGLE
jgi:hypothetical protein